MKIDVNGTPYDIKNIGERVWLDNNEITIKLSEDEIIIEGNTFYIDFVEHGDRALVILNGMAYMVSKSSSKAESIKEIKIPMRGKITDVLVRSGTELKEGDVIAILQAMKMDNQMKSPRNGKIKEIKVSKNQSVKEGDILVTFE
ncbi:MAG TPA: biotin/lipoyl-containing protein [Candidatus Bathyarchaeia archaeon]|jgi:biotin carboxyl carrier protein|nr:biotin/lipoyl-containing protein [Candidatus Bathyarchaeia archaeon]